MTGVVIEGYQTDGVDVQYPWESSPRRAHRHRLHVDAFAIDRHPVTNAQFKAFVDASGYAPRDPQNFLAHWVDGAPPAGWEQRPVTWVSIEDARTYAAWAGKRLPREWEWQYAAQGTDGRRYPWGDDWRDDAVPAPSLAREMPDPPVVGIHAAGASPFGVEDLVGDDLAVDRRISRRSCGARQCSAAAIPISRRPRTGISRRPMRSISMASIC